MDFKEEKAFLNSKSWPMIRRYFWADDSLCDYVHDDLLGRCSDASNGTKTVFISLLLRSAWCGILEDTFVLRSPKYPLYSGWLEHYKASMRPLIDAGLIETDDKYSFNQKGRAGECKKYWIPLHIVEQIQILILNMNPNCIKFNLYDRKKRERKGRILTAEQPSLYVNRNLITSKLVAESIEVITKKGWLLNYKEVDDYYKKLLRVWQRLTKSGRLQTNPLMNEQQKKVRNDIINKFNDRLNVVGRILMYLGQGERVGDFALWQPAYMPTSTGRITELNYGLQGCPRKVKALLLSGTDYINLDLKSSQLYWLYYYTKDAELLNTIHTIYSEAELLGFSKDVIKGAQFGILFNGGSEKNGGCYKLKDYAKKNNLDYAAVMKLFEPIARAAVRFADSLLRFGRWSNLSGVKMSGAELDTLVKSEWDDFLTKYHYLKHIKDEWVESAKRNKLLALYLQGAEAFVIHTITVESEKYNFKVVSNQHDGLIISGDKSGVYTIVNKICDSLKCHLVLTEKPVY